MRKTLIKQLGALLALLLLFASVNGLIYGFLTRRLSNHFSSTDAAKMIDVGSFLPHEPESDLALIQTDFRMEGELPVLDGAAALVPVYASVIHSVYPEGSVTYEGGSFSDDNYYGENFAPDSKMQYKNTVRGYEAIVDGTTDILFCAAPSEAQKQYAEEKGVELVYVPIGLEAFVFFVHEKNPVESLTVEQIRGIYGGEYKSWKDLGGSDRPINPVTRLSGSGSQSVMDSFMAGREIAEKSPLAAFGGSIGFSFRYYMDGIVGNEKVKMLALNGVYPSAENIRNGSYPIIAQFYAIHRADNPNPNIQRLIQWLLSTEGQDLIEACGYVRISE